MWVAGYSKARDGGDRSLKEVRGKEREKAWIQRRPLSRYEGKGGPVMGFPRKKGRGGEGISGQWCLTNVIWRVEEQTGNARCRRGTLPYRRMKRKGGGGMKKASLLQVNSTKKELNFFRGRKIRASQI